MSRRASSRPGWFLAAGVVLGCAHGAQDPGGTVAAFGDALARGDAAAAYALTSAGYRRRTPFETFTAAMAPAEGETQALGRRMAAAARRSSPRVELEMGPGERVPLVLEDGRWRIDEPDVEAWGQATPQAALRTFVRAVEARRYDVLLRLVPDRYRAGLSIEVLRAFWEGPHAEERRALMARLRTALGSPIVESADEARFPVPPDHQVRLIREAGRWKIDEPDESCQVTNGDGCPF